MNLADSFPGSFPDRNSVENSGFSGFPVHPPIGGPERKNIHCREKKGYTPDTKAGGECF